MDFKSVEGPRSMMIHSIAISGPGPMSLAEFMDGCHHGDIHGELLSPSVEGEPTIRAMPGHAQLEGRNKERKSSSSEGVRTKMTSRNGTSSQLHVAEINGESKHTLALLQGTHTCSIVEHMT
jgi:hypothetical protein